MYRYTPPSFRVFGLLMKVSKLLFNLNKQTKYFSDAHNIRPNRHRFQFLRYATVCSTCFPLYLDGFFKALAWTSSKTFMNHLSSWITCRPVQYYVCGLVCGLSRIIPCVWSLLYISYGPCGLVSSGTCYVCYTLTLFVYVVTVSTSAIVFEIQEASILRGKRFLSINL